MNKRTTKKIQPELKPNSEQKADDMHVSPDIANTNVIGSQSPLMSLNNAILVSGNYTVKNRSDGYPYRNISSG